MIGWVGVTLLIAAAVAPLVPFAVDQFQANQAAGRGFDAPSQAGKVEAGHEIPGIYTALTNAVWALLGYHADGFMASVSSLWPLAMLAALLLLGRRSRPLTLFVAACALVPALLLFAAGHFKPFLFEIRYFAAAVPLLLVLLARGATGWTRGWVATGAVGLALVAGLGAASADQQLNGSNPRVYDFKGAIEEIRADSRPGDVVVYEPSYLRDVVGYYGDDLRSGPVADSLPRRADTDRVYLLASFQDHAEHRAATREAISTLERDFDLTREFKRPQIHVWIFDKGARR
jgi:hypothetical protein